MKIRYSSTLAAAVVAMLAAGSPARAQPAQTGEFYAGKQLNVVVALAAGGTVDNFVRMLVPYLRRHIPGNPNVIAQNMAGAGGINAARAVLSAPADGYTLALFSNGTAISGYDLIISGRSRHVPEPRPSPEYGRLIRAGR